MKKILPLKKMKARGGQVAVVLIVIIAIALVLYAAILNLNKIAQTKTMVETAATAAASQLGSYMASYGESILQTTLGGETEVCQFTGVLVLVILIIVVLILLIISIFFPPAAGLISVVISFMGGVAGLAVGLALLLIALSIQLTVIQPGETKLWNKYMEGQLIPLDDAVERGIQTGLVSLVSDNARVLDEYDLDLDTLYSDGTGNEDYIGRFSFYYMERLKKLQPRKSANVAAFITALRDFLYADKTGDGWGLYDAFPDGHACNEANNLSSPYKPSACDPCCLPLTLDGQLVRPDCCDSTNPKIPSCGSANACGSRSGPWGPNGAMVYDPFSGSPYKDLYEPYLDNFENNDYPPPDNIISFREKLGRDDEIIGWEKDPKDPNGSQIVSSAGDFQVKDTEGYYRHPVHLPNYDKKRGAYSLFYKLADWGPDLSTPPAQGAKPEQCHWCDPQSGCKVPANQPLEIRPLSLSPSPGTYSGGWCVDQKNVKGQEKPVKPDNIGNFVRLTINTNSTCANDSSDINRPLWKRGGDRFCNTLWPYAVRCGKHNSTCPSDPDNCVCSDASAALWPDDTLDDMVYGMGEFIQWADLLIKQYDADPVNMTNTVRDWYPSVADWIEPQGSYSARGSDGGLIVWMKELQQWRDALDTWLDTDYQGTSWGDVWCYPDITERHTAANPNSAKYMPDGEFNAINAVLKDIGNVPGVKNMDAVVACLNWNAEDPVPGTGMPSKKGNYDKFELCSDPTMCGIYWDSTCSKLPRSLLPTTGTGPNVFDQTAPTNTPDPDFAPVLLCLFGDPAQSGAGACDNQYCDPVASRFLWTGATWSNSYCKDIAGNWNWGTYRDCNQFPSTCNQYFNLLADWAAQPSTSSNPGHGGSCMDKVWLDKVQKSADNAQNQVEKFRHRLKFLDDGNPSTNAGVWEQASQFWKDLDKAWDKFQNFLTGPNSPAEKFTNEVKNLGALAPALPSQAIYAWQGDPPKPKPIDPNSNVKPLDPPRPGYWHIVRVDARVPDRCLNTCGADATTTPPYKDPIWPTVATRTISWGNRRCYSLKAERGVVKARVTRFDEDRDPGNLIFPMGEKIWDFKFFHPGARPASQVDQRITQDCLGPGNLIEHAKATGAFMISQRVENRQCWKTVNDILRSGVVSEKCTEYYVRDADIVGSGPTGFFIKFVKCNKFDD